MINVNQRRDERAEWQSSIGDAYVRGAEKEIQAKEILSVARISVQAATLLNEHYGNLVSQPNIQRERDAFLATL